MGATFGCSQTVVSKTGGGVRLQTDRQTDGRTDRQTDTHTHKGTLQLYNSLDGLSQCTAPHMFAILFIDVVIFFYIN